MWIGDDAIPCTPGISKVRSRTKANSVRGLRLKNKEEELMKLAKQFDKNLTEAIQEQDTPCQNCTRLPSDTKVSVKCQGDAQAEDLQHLLGERPQFDAALPFGVIKGDAETAEQCEHSGEKPIDLDAEVALNTLFDCSPQKCSSELSQGSSNSDFHDSQNALLAKEHISEATAGAYHGPAAAGAPQRHGSAPASDCRGPIIAEKTKMVLEKTIQSAVISKTEPAVSSNVVSNGIEDWDADLLSDDSFVMQITQNPELIGTPQNAFPGTFQDSCKTMERTINLDRPNSARYAFPKSFNDVPQKSDFRLKNNAINSFSKSGQDKISGYNSIPEKPENKSVTEGFTRLKSVIGAETKAASVSVHSNLPKTLTGKFRSNGLSIYSEPSAIFSHSNPKDQQELARQASSNHLGAVLPKKHPSSFGDWNEPRISDDILDLFCESDSLWGVDCEDDDLLYRVCDDVERNTLSQDVAKENVKTTLVVVSAAKLEVDPGLVPKQGLANCPQPQKSRKTFSLNAPLTTAALLTDENSSDSCLQRGCVPFKNVSVNSVPGKLYRSNLVPDSSLASGSCSASMSDPCLNTDHSMQWQNVTRNVGKVQNVSSCNQASNEKSKYAFRKKSSSQALILDNNSVTGGSLGGAPLALGESKNGPNILLPTAVQAIPKTTFRRHLSDSFAHSEMEQKNRKCSQEEIARKRQEALERRKCKMQALLKNTAPT
uniref:ewing's tumor-associated antigen 1 n=1 Tax=Euleptes europaea TaxID=460621 RepID=UPI00254263B3|nr:ewing's tumor-associated antigen 1 [Euleptes europaea]